MSTCPPRPNPAPNRPPLPPPRAIREGEIPPSLFTPDVPLPVVLAEIVAVLCVCAVAFAAGWMLR